MSIASDQLPCADKDFNILLQHLNTLDHIS